MTTVNRSVIDCPNLKFHNFHTLRLVLRTFTDVFVLLDVADVHQCKKVDFPYLLFLCAFFLTSSHSFSMVAFSSGINIAWNERSFVCASRFPEACVSERRISRVFWTIRNSRFLEFLWTEQHSEFILLSSQFLTWEYLVLPWFSGLLEEFCLTDMLCRETWQHVLAFTCKGN